MPSLGFFELLLLLTLRYLVFAGGAYLWVWVWKRREFAPRRIQAREPAPGIVRREFFWSLVTTVVFALSGKLLFVAKDQGLTLLYDDIAIWGWLYFVLSIPLLLFLHDTYFYWTHRLMHKKWLFKRAHRVHHDSRVPTPLASFSFHPIEAVIEAAILPLLVLIVPVHPAAFLVFLMSMTVLGVTNHLGYEIFPRGFDEHWLGRWLISATHHDHHHQNYNENLGLYFTFWDRAMGTQQPSKSVMVDLSVSKVH